MMTEFIMQNQELSEPSIAFFGDEYVNDIHFAHSQPFWDGIAVIEELCMVPDYKIIEKGSALTPLTTS